jgi:hypothetical protein|tara:strand:- start:201 stop:503 length:303 start_codon:yes stop_codon:yes gene_type:complete
MKFLILDAYPGDDWRLAKDTAGGYGTGNDFGNSFFSKLNNKFSKKPSNFADEIYNICTNQEYLNYSRKYLVKNKVTKSSNLSYKLDLQDKLWEISLKIIN